MILIWKIAFLIVIGLGLLVLDERYPTALADRDTVATMVLLVSLIAATLFGGGPIRRDDIWVARRRRAAMTATVWIGVLGALGLVYEQRDSLHQGALKALSALQPGMPVALSEQETVLTRSSSGHFTAVADINGAQVTMLVDTGATDVALPYEDAERIGVDMKALVFDRPVMTANGDAMVAQVRLEEMRVGSIRVRDVRASIAEPEKLGGALLGMSFLGKLTEVAFRGDQLVLKQ